MFQCVASLNAFSLKQESTLDYINLKIAEQIHLPSIACVFFNYNLALALKYKEK